MTIAVAVGEIGLFTYNPVLGGPMRQLRFSYVDLSPSEFLPDPAELPFEDASMEMDLYGELSDESPNLEAALEMADSVGATNDLLTRGAPWIGLLAMEMERQVAVAEEREARARWKERGEGAAGDAPRPQLQLEPLLDAAERLVQWHPDHQVGDYARLYRVYALGHLKSSTMDEDALIDAGSEALMQTSDPLVQDVVAQQLADAALGSGLPLTEEVLDVVAAIHDDTESIGRRAPLVELGMRSALAVRDTTRARAWAERFADSLDARCAEWSEGCQGLRDELDVAEAWVAVDQEANVSSWQAGVRVVVQRCAEDHPPPRPVVTGQATWRTSWEWHEWSSNSDLLADCVEAAAPLGPPPPPDQQITLHAFTVP
ncbi:MAG: hypothetical protein KTR31_28840 [Myxococcales bacterium]|nr:hypothetical protein [Myxococcales bacterium]